ncbi:MAG: FtsW/RodA/SpoVE family cell cycle protein [Lachnospiraceae bacterium]|nr:FtsW/RodA/SpoVE family cell cycle protein [Lachnospiraceae bacterium]
MARRRKTVRQIGIVRHEKFHLRDFDFRLLIYVLALSILGILYVHSATANEVTQSLVSTTVKQIIGVSFGFVLMVVLAFLDYIQLVRFSWVFYLFSILLLVYLLVFGQAIYGAKRWLYFPFLGTIQPSEFTKPALLLFLSFIIFRFKDKISKIYVILLYFAAATPILVLVLMEPDLSTAVVLAIIIVACLFLGEISYKWVVGVLIAMIPVILFLVLAVYQPEQTILNSFLKPHQVERINAYFFPENYPDVIRQQNNSVMAIASGGFFGKGIGTSSLDSVKNGNFLSEEQCDFIFAIVGEEGGFLGCAIIVILLGLVVFECFHVAHKCEDLAGRVIAGGAGASIGFQSLINISVALGLVPNTGIPLPFISAGLSSLLSTYLLIGAVLSIKLYGGVQRRVII